MKIFKRPAKGIVILLAVLTVLCCGDSGNRRTQGEPVVIRIAHNWPREMDTSFRDPITGEPRLGQQELNARIYAEEQVLQKYNVKLAWIPYPSDLREDILRSVLAGDPLAELVRIINASQGLLLGQNVLQPIDDFEYLFDDEDSRWMFMGKAYGRHYFINNVMRYGNDAPLVYNIGMLDRVPALKENGKTVLPVDLWLEGKWTWSVFEDYLQKVHDYWIQTWDGRMAYGAQHAVAAQMAMHSNGASVYGDNGLEINTPEAKEAVAFIERLVSKNLIRCIDLLPGTSRIQHLRDVWRLQWGHSVFANLQQWLSGSMVNHFNERGDTIGIVPFPRPDHMEPGDPRYRQMNDAKDCYGVPRGVSKEMAELAVKAFREYTISFYKKMAESDRALDYLQADGPVMDSAVKMFLDVTNEEYGDKLLEVWRYLGSNENIIINEYAKNVGIWDIWSEDILGDSLYRVRGSSQYSVQVEAKMSQVNEIMNTISRAIRSDQLFDNVPPVFTDVEGARMIFAAGTAGIDWSQYLTINDNVDGPIVFSNAVTDLSAVNFSQPGRYENGAVFSVSDSSGNTGTATRTVTVFDGSHTTPPGLVIKSEYRVIKLDEKTADINWRNDFVESATDKDGLDIRDSLVADLSEINTTTAGQYKVTLTVTDYAGNQSSAELTVTVE